MKHYILTIISLICLFIATGCEKAPAAGEDEVTEAIIPVLPADPQPENTSFQHRILLLQHTGTACPNCPRLMESLKALSLDQSYSAKYHHVASHSYNADDPAYTQAAKNLSQAYCSGYYPELTFNLTKENTGVSTSVETIKEHIDALHKNSAEVGITAAAQLTGKMLGVNVGIKTAVNGNYRIAAWVLEDGIAAKQDGANEEWMHTHNNAVRIMAGKTINTKINGEKVGDLEAGKTLELPISIELEDGWKGENCKVIVIVTTANSEGRFDLVNCAVCPVNGNIEYKYN